MRARRTLRVVGLVLFVVACGGEAPDADAEPDTGDAQRSTATMECELPAELPDDTPLPPGCNWVFEPTNVQDRYTIIGTRSSAPQPEVVAFFEQEMPALGWEITTNSDRDDGGRSLAMERGEERLILEIYPRTGEEGQLTVQYVLR